MSRLPPLNALRAFETSARLGSFTRAADELHVTQAAVSQQVKQLEQHLGSPLFIREAKGLRLTEVGRRFVALDVDARKRLFGQHLLAYVPLAALIRRVLDEKFG